MSDFPAGYRIERTLKEGASYLATSPSGRRVVLKALDDDCLLGAQLHPLIKDRLGRVRELAHLDIANLHGVERHDRRAMLVWQYVEGMTLAEYLAGQGQGSGFRVQGSGEESPSQNPSSQNPSSLNPEPRTLNPPLPSCLPLAYELVLAVESLHVLGIIHGALHQHNIIITPTRSICLTHISPLLYTEERADIEPLLRILREMGCSHALDGAAEAPASLRELATRLAMGEGSGFRVQGSGEGSGFRVQGSGGGSASSQAGSLHHNCDAGIIACPSAHALLHRPIPTSRDDPGPRRRALLGAVAAALIGSALAWGIWQLAPGDGPGFREEGFRVRGSGQEGSRVRGSGFREDDSSPEP